MSSAFLTNPGDNGFADLMERISSQMPAASADTAEPANLQHLTELAGSLAIDLSADDDDPHDSRSLSYESALRRHARIPSHVPAPPIAPHIPTHSAQLDTPAAAHNSDTGEQASTEPSSDRQTLTQQLLASARQAQAAELKRCTISVRLNQEESEVLRLRAAESGMTVSAYLRSCVLEADQLRAQVKTALADLKHSANTQPVETNPEWSPLPPHLPNRSRLKQNTAFFTWLRRTWALLLGQRSPLRLPAA